MAVARLDCEHADRTTLYASDGDVPVHLSAKLHDAPRAGYFTPYTVVPGVDTAAVWLLCSCRGNKSVCSRVMLIMNLYSVCADAIVFVHAAYVGFVVLGLLAILVGSVLRWQWVRNVWFRIVHLSTIGIVVVEALFGITCPLTTWENRLRQAGGETARAESFVGRWVHDLLFYDAPPWMFTVVYCLFGAVVLATFVIAPPRWPLREQPRD